MQILIHCACLPIDGSHARFKATTIFASATNDDELVNLEFKNEATQL